MATKKMRIAIDCDDAAVDLKREIVKHLRGKGVEVTDLDYLGAQRADYPEIGFNLARRIQKGDFDRGILMCGTGLGMAIITRGPTALLCRNTPILQAQCPRRMPCLPR